MKAASNPVDVSGLPWDIAAWLIEQNLSKP